MALDDDQSCANKFHPDCNLSPGHKGKKHPRGLEKDLMRRGVCAVLAHKKRDGKIKRRDVRSQDVWPKNISLYLHELPLLVVG